METIPLVSIVIPCWGCVDYIGEAIQSALNQDYSHFEIIVIEDCGFDGTYEKALTFQDTRLRVYRNGTNLGQYANKNRGLKYANGSFIKYLDGDDVLEPNCLSLLMSTWKASEKQPAVVFGQYRGIDRQGCLTLTPRKWGFSGLANGKKVLEVIIKKRQPGSRFGNVTPQLFYRPALEMSGGFPDDNIGAGDDETFLKILALHDVYFLDVPVARYRKHPGGIGNRLFGIQMSRDYLTMVDRLSAFFKSLDDIPSHLHDDTFIREWKVWASSHNILATFQHKLRRRSSTFDEIRKLYSDNGLQREFDNHIMNQFLPYIIRTLLTKVRRKLNLPQHPQLFTPKEIRYICIDGTA